MSTFEDKVTVVTDFLRNRASLQRLTNHREIGDVAGELLYARQMRRISGPVRRDKVIDVLRAIDDDTVGSSGFMFSALVVHFWDNAPGHRFFAAAIERGLLDEDADEATREAFHAGQLGMIYGAFPSYVGPEGAVVTPDTVEELDGQDDDAEAEAEVF